jgi:hypothetical protein
MKTTFKPKSMSQKFSNPKVRYVGDMSHNRREVRYVKHMVNIMVMTTTQDLGVFEHALYDAVRV